MMNYVLVLVGGSCGAISRLAVASLAKRLISSEFPIATLLINWIGSFFIGLLMAVNTDNLNHLLLGTGFLGGFTTFSTFQMENVTLFQQKNYITLFVYITSSIVVGIILAILGLHLGHLSHGLLK